MRATIAAPTLLAGVLALVPARASCAEVEAAPPPIASPAQPTEAQASPGSPAPPMATPAAPAAPLASPGATREAAEKPPEAARHAADERFFLTPSALLLEPGTAVLSDDEVLLVHLGVGVRRWLQLDASIGVLPIPGAAGGMVPAHGIVAGGGAGIAVVGAATLGLKLGLLAEGPIAPGVAAGYDMVDLFGGAIGGGGLFLLGNGVGAVGAGAIGGANVQLNVFSLAVNKHLGRRVQLGAGAYLVDNHHFLPQVAGFTAGTTTGASVSGSATIGRLPTKLLPFANAEVWVGGGFSAITEVFPRGGSDTFGTAGLRWVSGRRSREGLASFLRVKLDAAAIWGRGPDTSTRRGRIVAFPWLGLGLYLG